MDARILLFLCILFIFVSNVFGKSADLKFCVVGDPKAKSSRTTKYCDLLEKSKRSPVSCVYAADRLECLRAVSGRRADFSAFEAEDLYFSTLWEGSSVLVTSEIRELKEKAFRFGVVAMVRKEGNSTGVEDLRGKRLCHPGAENGPEWSSLFSEYLEERVAPSDCDERLSLYEDRIKTSSDYFGAACKAGPWVSDVAEDDRLKKRYSNLCSLCDGGDCGNSDKYRGSGGSLVCFKDGVGDVLWAKYEDVKAHIKFLESDSSYAASEYYYLCDDGSLMPLQSGEPCLWLAEPWQVLGANPKSATAVQKLVNTLSDNENVEWKENFLRVVELYLKYIENLVVARTPEDFLRRIPGYLSSSAMSRSNCKPKRSVNLCVTSEMEKKKCEWMSKAGSALGIRPSLECIRKLNSTACFDSVQKKETDVAIASPDHFHDAAVKFNLKKFLWETGNHFNDSYMASIVVKKTSNLKKLRDLRGKKICLTRKNGIGWWSLLHALHQKTLIGSPCRGLFDFFGKVCVVENAEEEGLARCCSSDGTGSPESDVLRCLRGDECDAAVLDFNTLRKSSESKSQDELSKSVTKFSEFSTLCDSSGNSCHWMWSYPNYLLTHAQLASPRGLEIYNVFLLLGQYFGNNFRNTNQMLKIFGPFLEAENILFKDKSATFVASDRWNEPNEYLNTLDQMKLCSKSSSQDSPFIISLVVAGLFCFIFS